MQRFTDYPNIWEPPSNSMRQKGEMKFNTEDPQFWSYLCMGIPYVPVVWVLKCSVLVSSKTQYGTPDVPGFYKSQKYDISAKAYEINDFIMAGGNIYRSKTAINQPLMARNKKGEENM